MLGRQSVRKFCWHSQSTWVMFYFCVITPGAQRTGTKKIKKNGRRAAQLSRAAETERAQIAQEQKALVVRCATNETISPQHVNRLQVGRIALNTRSRPVIIETLVLIWLSFAFSITRTVLITAWRFVIYSEKHTSKVTLLLWPSWLLSLTWCVVAVYLCIYLFLQLIDVEVGNYISHRV